jgi:hypothetical protein
LDIIISPRIIVSDDAENEEEPEEVRQAWDELIVIQKEQDRYAGIKLDLEQDLKETRKTAVKLEDVSTMQSKFLHLSLVARNVIAKEFSRVFDDLIDDFTKSDFK